MNVLVRDSSGGMQLTFFNMPFLKNVLKPGSSHVFRGRVQARGPAMVMEQPRLYKQEEYNRYLAFIQPRYALTKGLTNQALQKAVKQALTYYAFGADPYPRKLREEYDLMDRREAMHNMHFPHSGENGADLSRFSLGDGCGFPESLVIPGIIAQQFPHRCDIYSGKYLPGLFAYPL